MNQIGNGKDTRALIYDAKGDLYSLLAGMGATNIDTLNPFDERCVAPDFAADFTSPAAALQLATLLVPENPKASQPFFDNAARTILTKVILAFIQNAPGAWDLRDVILATGDRERLTELLGSTPQTTSALQYFEREESARDVMSTLASRLAPFELIAAAWSKATKKLSLREWLTDESILILGNDESLRAAMQAVNGLLFQRLSELSLKQSESDTRETWFFLDEVREAGKLEGLGRLLTNGRSKGVCVCLGFQDIDGMREVYGERLANELIGQCNNRAVLRLESETTAEWAAKYLGVVEVLEESTSESENQNGLRQALSSSKSLAIKQSYNVMPSQLLDIPLTDRTNGLTGYYQTPFTGAFKQTLTSAWLTKHLQEPDVRVRNTMPRDEADQYLQPWENADTERLTKNHTKPSTRNELESGGFGVLAGI